MKKILSLLLMSLFFSVQVYAMGEDDPLLTMVNIEKLEIQDADEHDPVVLDAYGWIGKDLNKLWIKTEVERVQGETEEVELQLLYSRAIYAFWDVQLGWRRDIKPKPKRDWLAIGLQGLAPYYFETDMALFIGDDNRFAARIDAEYEYMFTQRLVLSPEVELNLYSKDDPETGTGKGLADMSAGLRLRYEFRREFAPYIGINWSKQFGDTADYTEAAGEEISDTRLVIGVRAWF